MKSMFWFLALMLLVSNSLAVKMKTKYRISQSCSTSKSMCEDFLMDAINLGYGSRILSDCYKDGSNWCYKTKIY